MKDTTPLPFTLTRPVRCTHLLGRTEFRSGCGGMSCVWGCVKGLRAIPVATCQTCPEYEGDFNEDGTGPDWLS